jgi:hypothetical protein
MPAALSEENGLISGQRTLTRVSVRAPVLLRARKNQARIIGRPGLEAEDCRIFSMKNFVRASITPSSAPTMSLLAPR